jgi:hypothetical protein
MALKDGRFPKSQAAVFGVHLCLKANGYSKVVGPVAQFESSQNGNSRVTKGLFDNGIYIVQGAARLKGSENDPTHAIQMTAQVKLGKHAVNTVRGFLSIFQEQETSVEVWLIGGPQKMAQAREVSPHQDTRGLPRTYNLRLAGP